MASSPTTSSVGRSTTSFEAFVPRRRVSGHRVADVSRATTCSHPSGIASSMILVRYASNATEHGTTPPIVSPLDRSFFPCELCLREYHPRRIHHYHRIYIFHLPPTKRKTGFIFIFLAKEGHRTNRRSSSSLESWICVRRIEKGRKELAVVQIERTFFL